MNDIHSILRFNYNYRWGEARYKNGGRYLGYWIEGIRHGYGEAEIYVYQKETANAMVNQMAYQSNWESGRVAKFGQILRREKYAGDWRDGLKDGFGIFEVEQFAISEADEFAKVRKSNNEVVATLCYEGVWKEGVYDGWV